MRYALLMLFALAGIFMVSGVVRYMLGGTGMDEAMLSCAVSLMGIVISCVYGE